MEKRKLNLLFYFLLLLTSKYISTKNSYLKQGNYPFFHLPPFKNVCFENDYHLKTEPLLIFPGLNDWCGGIDYFIEGFQRHTNNEIHCIEYGKNIEGVFTNMKKLIEKSCLILEKLSKIVNLKNGIIVIGLSMGGLIARGVVQECEIGKYSKKLLTFGTPHLGVAKVPTYEDSFLEKVFNKIAVWIIYKDFIQKFLSGSNFFRYPKKYQEYLKSDAYIKNLNNEVDIIPQYKKRIKNLDLFVNFGFEQEIYLVPKETVHWGFYRMEEPFELLNYKNTRIYQEDTIGIKTLDEQNKFKLEFIYGIHQNLKIFHNPSSAKAFYYII